MLLAKGSKVSHLGSQWVRGCELWLMLTGLYLTSLTYRFSREALRIGIYATHVNAIRVYWGSQVYASSMDFWVHKIMLSELG